MLGEYIEAVAVASGVSSALFLLVSMAFLRLQRLYPHDTWLRLSIGYLMLSVGQAAMATSLLAPEPRYSYGLYTLSSSASLSGAYLILSSRRGGEALATPLLTLYTLSPAVLDISASAVLFMASRGSRGFVKRGLLVLSLAYTLRGVWIVSPDPLGLVWLLLVAEALRVLGALTMTLVYVWKVFS